jgi:hypothetical protein
MRKVIRLTERDLSRIVKRVINEIDDDSFTGMSGWGFKPGHARDVMPEYRLGVLKKLFAIALDDIENGRITDKTLESVELLSKKLRELEGILGINNEDN